MGRSGVLVLLVLSMSACGSTRVDSDGAVPDSGALGDGSRPDSGSNPDGGTRPPGPVIEMCARAGRPAPASGTCTTTAGDASLLITADVLTPGRVLRGGQVLVDATGNITCVACDCMAMAGGATQIDCPQGVLSPGFLNAHDHITYDQNAPYVPAADKVSERFEHRHEWRRGSNGHTNVQRGIPGDALLPQMQWHELRFVMGGATSVNGSGTSAGFLRNLDKAAAAQEGLNQTAVRYETFPLDDTNGTLRTMGCMYGMIDTMSVLNSVDAYTPHVSEGVGAEARNEFTCLSMGANDLVQDKSAFIHGVAAQPADMALMAQRGTALIWSPRSNVSLYGDTARVTAYARLGVAIALGTDWVPSGSMNMLRELQCADSLNTNYFDGYFSDEQLWLMATRTAAEALAVDDVVGTIAVGKVADLAIYDGAQRDDHRAVIEATAADVALVLRGGRVLYGDAAVVAALPTGDACDTLDVCTRPKRACVMRETGMTLAALQTANSGRYPLFFCEATPMNEPSCTPTRPMDDPSPMLTGVRFYNGRTAEDTDGDGLPNAEDLCPRVFDPIRPLDSGREADADGDMVGDACDPCPLTANSTVCGGVDPNDSDGDGRPNAMDNCPMQGNADQADADLDMKGDVCDPCPMAANPGAAACPGTIPDVKRGIIAQGAQVSLPAAVVTAVGSNGFYIQVDPASVTGTYDPKYSGVFVYTGGAPMPAVVRGNLVTITSATIIRFPGTGMAGTTAQIQLGSSVYTVGASMGTLPTPVDIAPADVMGMRAQELEGTLVRVMDVPVDSVDTTAMSFVVGGLPVDPGLTSLAPLPMMGARFPSIVGVIGYARMAFRLFPRDATDITSGPPTLMALDPATSFVRVGQTGVNTFPQPLTVRFTRAVMADTMVTLLSGDPSVTVPASVTVPNGMASVVVPVTGASAGMATITATSGTVMRMATVRAIADTARPTMLTLTPATATAQVNGTVTFTVTVDVPAPTAGGLTVTLTDTLPMTTVPATVTIPADATTATFMVTAASMAESGMVTAAIASDSLTSSAMLTINAGSPGRLLINEVDYDQPGTDNAEFIELVNAGSTPVDLTGYRLFLVNGSNNMSYGTPVALGSVGMLAPGAYVVIAVAAVTTPAGVTRIMQTDAPQNGAAMAGEPGDGIAIVDASNTLVDGLSYESMLPPVTLAGVPGTFMLVKGTVSTAADSGTVAASLCRIPNATSTNNDSVDWVLCMTVTPGAANVR